MLRMFEVFLDLQGECFLSQGKGVMNPQIVYGLYPSTVFLTDLGTIIKIKTSTIRGF